MLITTVWQNSVSFENCLQHLKKNKPSKQDRLNWYEYYTTNHFDRVTFINYKLKSFLSVKEDFSLCLDSEEKKKPVVLEKYIYLAVKWYGKLFLNSVK